MARKGERATGGDLSEFGIIARYFAPLATGTAALGLRDDAAVLRPQEGQEIVLSCDTIVEGVHFLPDDPPETIGHKALAVSLSDLAAKGARPCVYLLALALPPDPSPTWLEGFAAGLGALQAGAGIWLAGGDTTATPGPVTITVTVLGLAPPGRAVLRLGAKQGDRLYVSGTIGDATLGLRLLKEPALAAAWGLSEEERAFLIDRYRRPEPRFDLALLVRSFAQASIDVSDGLVGDIEKLAKVSHVGATLEIASVPLSPAARKAVRSDPGLLEALITSGDDYEIVAVIPEAGADTFEAEAAAKRFTLIGRIEAGGEIRAFGLDGAPLKLTRTGFSHF